MWRRPFAFFLLEVGNVPAESHRLRLHASVRLGVDRAVDGDRQARANDDVAMSTHECDRLVAEGIGERLAERRVAHQHVGHSPLFANFERWVPGGERTGDVIGSGGGAGKPEVFVHCINGADGLMVDEADNLWVAANQADEIVVLNPSGRVIAKLGDFDGIDRKGAPIGLLFPASTVKSGKSIYVTNLALDLRQFGLPQTVDSQWAAQVTRYTISRIRARIPPVCGLPGTAGKHGCEDD